MAALAISIQRQGQETRNAGTPLVLDRPTVQALRDAMANLANLNAAERWEELSAGLLDLGRRLGSLLLSAIPGRGEGGPLEVALHLRDQGLMALPWELAADPEGEGDRFLFAPGAGFLTRLEDGLHAPAPRGLPSPPTVTLLAEKAAHFGVTDLSDSADSIRRALREEEPGPARPVPDLDVGNLRSAPSPLRHTEILHLLAHGYETGGIDARFEYGLHCASLRDLLPEDSYGEAPADRVAAELARHAPWEVLLLDACYSGGGFRWDGERWRDPLCTRADGLGGSVVVSFFDSIEIRKAQIFVRHFYEVLRDGEKPMGAVRAAREDLFRAEAGSPFHQCVWWKVRVARGR